MRTKGAKTEKSCWYLKIYYPNYVYKEQKYKTLRDVAIDLNISYNQVSELTNNGRNKGKSKYSFYPTIELYKINTDNTNTILTNTILTNIDTSECISDDDAIGAIPDPKDDY